MNKKDLHTWCGVPVDDLLDHPDRRVALRLCADRAEMARLMATELVEDIRAAATENRPFRVIVPCGPTGWLEPFCRLVNEQSVRLRHVEVFHMDECLDWQAKVLPRAHPYSFRGYMQRHFYDPIRPELAVPEGNRYWLEPDTVDEVLDAISAAPIDLTYGGWGQDGHIAYNQARRNALSTVTVDELRTSSVRIQENNVDTVIALAQRKLGGAYQFVPPMSVTLGVREVLSARKVRLFSDTGGWKQTALRVALFSPQTAEYPITLLQEHENALLTATVETADHPISRHPEWAFDV
ncbi:6-phosphogluconolactonase [Fodinicola acaciae]|uniref:6-phosphogluconolactonase n=1 Tax=Fodinicola acaciae TaxID=2681555 RepID=UPI0013D2DC73|nr:6-phosphogluconolactonase [Fodinicola acaciae]